MKGRGIGALCAAAACAVALAAAPSAVASSTGNPGTDTAISPGGLFDQAAQTFTVPAGADNFLFRLEVLGLINAEPQSFTIHATNGSGEPTGPALWTSPVLPASATYRPVTLYPNLTVTPGARYALVVGTGTHISIQGTSTSAYPDGGFFARFVPPPADNWSSFSTFDMGFLAEFNTGQVATTTNLDCSPASLPLDAVTTCTATLTVSGTGAPVASASIDMSTSGPGSIPSCVTDGTGSCSSTYTRSTAGGASITASWVGDAATAPSQASDSVTFTRRPTSQGLNCAPTTVKIGTQTSCTLTVTDTGAGTPSTPTGLAGATPDQAGVFGNNPCTLSSGACTITFAPGSGTVGTTTLTPLYGGNATHADGIGAATGITVVKRSSATALTCTPSSAASGQASTCAVTVSDPDPGTASTPTGTVALTGAGAGSLSAPSCTLTGGTCSVDYTPSGPGSSTITASYGGDGDHAASEGGSSVTVPAPPGCAKVQRKLNRLKQKLRRQQAGAGDSRKKARKRAKIKKNIADTKRRKRKRLC